MTPTAKFSFAKLKDFDIASDAWKKQQEKDGLPESKLSYAIDRVLKQLKKFYNDKKSELLDEELNEIESETIEYNKEGFVVYNKETNQPQRKMEKVKQAQKAKVRAIKKFEDDLLSNFDNSSPEKGIEIKTYFASALPENLKGVDIEAFSGLVIEESKANDLLAKLI